MLPPKPWDNDPFPIDTAQESGRNASRGLCIRAAREGLWLGFVVSEIGTLILGQRCFSILRSLHEFCLLHHLVAAMPGFLYSNQFMRYCCKGSFEHINSLSHRQLEPKQVLVNNFVLSCQ